MTGSRHISRQLGLKLAWRTHLEGKHTICNGLEFVPTISRQSAKFIYLTFPIQCPAEAADSYAFAAAAMRAQWVGPSGGDNGGESVTHI